MSTSAEVRSELAELDRAEEARSVRMKASLQQIVHVLQTVSYTHLTLPTSDLV